MSYSLGYLSMGFGSIYFDDQDPLRNDVVYTTSGGDAGERGSIADATVFNFELGAAHSVLFADDDWALRPGLGAGWQSNGEVSRYISDCQGCDSEVVLEDYIGGLYGSTQLGLYRRYPTAVGFSLLYQQFLGEVSEPALNWTLMAGFLFGVDGY